MSFCKEILDGSIFNFTCPHCNFSAHTEYPVLYDDMENHFIIYFCSKEDVEENARQLKEIIAEIKGSVPEEIFASSLSQNTQRHELVISSNKVDSYSNQFIDVKLDTLYFEEKDVDAFLKGINKDNISALKAEHDKKKEAQDLFN